jgi:hypothetical protein
MYGLANFKFSHCLWSTADSKDFSEWNKNVSHLFHSYRNSFYFRPSLNLRPFFNYLYHISQGIFVDTAWGFKFLLADTQFTFSPECLGHLTPILATIFENLFRDSGNFQTWQVYHKTISFKRFEFTSKSVWNKFICGWLPLKTWSFFWVQLSPSIQNNCNRILHNSKHVF